MAKRFVGSLTLAAFMQIVKGELTGKVDVAKILTTLEGYNPETDAEKVVAASLVAALKNQVDSIVGADGEGKVNDSDKLDGLDADAFLQVANVVTDWTQYNADDGTAENAKTVAAALVKALVDKVESLGITEDAKVASAVDADKLGGQTPDYYAKAEDLEGVVKVGEDGKVPSEVLPSYVDDVIEGYMSEGVLYEDAELTAAITPEKGKIYVDLASETNQAYRWSGSTYVEVSSNDMVEITEDEVQEMWDAVVAADEAEEESGEVTA